jgi:thiol-disulfide isomerase/thioredoxin
MNKQTLYNIIKKEKAIISFYADWCGGCQVAAPMIQKIATKLNYRLIRINENEELEEEFAVDYYPHILVVDNGKIRSYPGLQMIKDLYENTI